MEQNNYIHFPLMTVGEAAKYLGVGRKVIYQLIEFDQIQSVLSGAGTLVTRLESTALQPLPSVPPTQKLPAPVRRRKKRRPVQASNAPHPVIVAMGTTPVLMVALL